MTALKNYLARFLIRLRMKNFPVVSISVPADFYKITGVLICLPPGQRELTMIKNLLPQLQHLFSGLQLTLLASPESSIFSIFPRRGLNILAPSKSHHNWAGLPKSAWLETLKKEKFEMILDFNLTPNYFVQGILLNFPSAIRVGIANQLGHPFYNLEVKTRYYRDEKNIYKSLIETLDRLFHPQNTADETANN